MFRRCSIRGFPLLIFSLLANTRALQFHLSGDRIRFFPNIHAAPLAEPGGCGAAATPGRSFVCPLAMWYNTHAESTIARGSWSGPRSFVKTQTMSETVTTVEIPYELAQRCGALAIASNRRLEDAVVDWIGRAVADPPLGSLPDGELLALCDATLDAPRQEELSALLAELREGTLATSQRARLEELMAEYRRGLVLKARALTGAVARGLRPRLDDHAA